MSPVDLIERLRAAYAAWNNPPSEGLPVGAGVVLEAANALTAKDTALAEMRAELERVKKALEAGRQLANVAYNIGQLGHVTDAGSLRSLREAQLAFDVAVSAARALSPTNPSPDGNKGEAK